MLSFDITTVYQPKFCKECGDPISDRKRNGICYKCEQRALRQKRLASRRAAGLCPYCGNAKPEEGHSRCSECLEKKRQYNARIKEGWK